MCPHADPHGGAYDSLTHDQRNLEATVQPSPAVCPDNEVLFCTRKMSHQPLKNREEPRALVLCARGQPGRPHAVRSPLYDVPEETVERSGAGVVTGEQVKHRDAPCSDTTLSDAVTVTPVTVRLSQPRECTAPGVTRRTGASVSPSVRARRWLQTHHTDANTRGMGHFPFSPRVFRKHKTTDKNVSVKTHVRTVRVCL